MLFLLVLLLPCSAFSYDFSSEKSTFSKESMELVGTVIVKTPFGTIRADNAELTKKGPFVFSGHVSVALNEGQNILCDKAMYNTESLRGECFGGKDPVQITSPYKKSKLVTVTCRNISFFLPPSSPQEIQGNGDVRIEMTGGSLASGDRIDILKNKDASSVTLTSIDPKACVFDTPLGLHIESPRIEFLENDGSVRFQKPQGTFIKKDENVEFTSDSLTWIPAERKLLMEGKSKISMKPLLWDVEGTISFLIKEDEKDFEAKIVGNMVFSNSKRGMTLTCDGKANYASHALAIDKNPDSPQVQIIDRFGQIFANNAVLFFDPKSTRFEAENIELKGDVSLINKLYSAKDQEASQFILADAAFIELKTESARLMASQGKRVLIMDKLNRMQVSAPSITVKRTEGITPFAIKGSGDVRFSFKDDELSEIKKRFFEKRK